MLWLPQVSNKYKYNSVHLGDLLRTGVASNLLFLEILQIPF